MIKNWLFLVIVSRDWLNFPWLANSEGLQPVVSWVFTRFTNISSSEVNCDQPVFCLFLFWSALMPYNFEPKAMKKITAKAKSASNVKESNRFRKIISHKTLRDTKERQDTQKALMMKHNTSYAKNCSVLLTSQTFLAFNALTVSSDPSSIAKIIITAVVFAIFLIFAEFAAHRLLTTRSSMVLRLSFWLFLHCYASPSGLTITCFLMTGTLGPRGRFGAFIARQALA